MIRTNNLHNAIYIANTDISKAPFRKAGIWQGVHQYKDMDMRVLRNFSFQAPVPTRKEKLQEETQADQPWSEVHFQERVSGKPLNPGESYKIWPYNSFKKEQDPYMDGEVFSHTYMERFWPKRANDLGGNRNGIRYTLGDLADVIKQINDNPLTRQAYLPIFFPEDTGAKGGIRVPCTLGYLFEVWDGKLDCTYYIRSCDSFRHFRNDVYLTARLMIYIAQRTFTTTGNLTMHIANLHLFVNDEYAFNKKENGKN